MYKDKNTQFESLVQIELIYFEPDDIPKSGVANKTG